MQEETKNALIEKVLGELAELRKKVSELETLKRDLPTAEQLAADVAGKPISLTPLTRVRKRGVGAKPLVESEIIEAQKDSLSEVACARKLNVSFLTYRKYARMYGLYGKLKNLGAKGIFKPQNPNLGKYPLNDILDGKHPEYPIFRLKQKLLRSGIKKQCCEQCGFSERRLIDNHMPLLLIFEDGNSKNHKLENIKVFCYNCAFTSGKLWVKVTKRLRWLNDPNRMLGAKRDTKEYPPET